MRTRLVFLLFTFVLSTPVGRSQFDLHRSSTIETIAGGEARTGNEFSLFSVSGLVADSRGNIYFSIQAKSQVFRLALDGQVTIFAGNGTRGVLPEFVVAYLNSRYGQDHIMRQASGMVQQGLPLQKVRCIPIPLLPEKLQRWIAGVVQTALTHLRSAQGKLVDAEQALLDALGLESWQPPEALTYARRASEVFAARRLDADYFAPRVTEILAHLRSNGRTIGEVAPVRHEQFIPGMTGEFNYIEINSVQRDGTATAERVSQREAPSRAKWYVRSGDIVSSTVRPIRPLSAIISQEQDGFVCSSGFAVLKPTAVSSEVLLTFLRLLPVRELMDLHASASMYPAIAERDLLQLPFRRISEITDKEIVQLVRLAHMARRKSRSLLEQAKRAVEIAIDQGENAAMTFMQEQHK